jgi:hypothetical protein
MGEIGQCHTHKDDNGCVPRLSKESENLRIFLKEGVLPGLFIKLPDDEIKDPPDQHSDEEDNQDLEGGLQEGSLIRQKLLIYFIYKIRHQNILPGEVWYAF